MGEANNPNLKHEEYINIFQRLMPKNGMYPLVICYIAMGNGHRNSGCFFEKSDFSTIAKW